MIETCFKKSSNILLFPLLFPGGKDFGDVFRQNVIMILYLSKLHAVVQCEKIGASAR